MYFHVFKEIKFDGQHTSLISVETCIKCMILGIKYIS